MIILFDVELTYLNLLVDGQIGCRLMVNPHLDPMANSVHSIRVFHSIDHGLFIRRPMELMLGHVHPQAMSILVVMRQQHPQVVHQVILLIIFLLMNINLCICETRSIGSNTIAFDYWR
jgi:hypothetical protein